MVALLQFYIELCLLRRAPQDLPASLALLWLVVVVDLLISVMVGLAADLSLGLAWWQGVADLVLTLGLLHLGLLFSGHPGRFLQLASALLGAGSLLGLFALVPLAFLTGAESRGETSWAGLPVLLLLFWSLLVTGHILRHGFGLRLGQGVVIAVAYNLLASTLVNSLFPGP